MPRRVTFGIELECYLPEAYSGHAGQLRAAEAVSRAIGKPCKIEGYGHRYSSVWKGVPDGSLGDYSRGIEFVSPALEGEEGIQEAEKVCNALVALGADVIAPPHVAHRMGRYPCGTHVHVKTDGVGEPAFLKSMTKLYATFESVIDSFMPGSRRLSNSRWAKSMTTVSFSALDAARSMTQARFIANPGRGPDDGRYYKVNYWALDRHGTVEFRQHSGTLDARKIRHWIQICIAMVNAALDNQVQYGTAERPRNRSKAGTKRHTIVEMILNAGPEGASRSAIVAATAWPSVSISQIATSNRLNIQTRRMGREVYYSLATAHTAAPNHPITLDGFADALALPIGIREYLAARRNELSGRAIAA